VRKNIFLVLLLGISLNLVAVEAQQDSSNWKTKSKETIRPWLVKIMGESKTNQWLGESPDEIKLPPIPEIVSNAKSVESMPATEESLTPLSETEKEYNYRFLQELYLVIKGVHPSDKDLMKWNNTLNQGGTREGIYRALVLDTKYMELEKDSRRPNDKAIAFTEEYMPKYLGLKMEHAVLEQVNFYTLKKEIVEKSLEVLDALSKNKKQLADWYAVFSAEMAEKHGEFLQGEIRKDTSKKRHQEWAMKVPAQHIRSEVIIKLHIVYNSLP
jgi:hypothetical protein